MKITKQQLTKIIKEALIREQEEGTDSYLEKLGNKELKTILLMIVGSKNELAHRVVLFLAGGVPDEKLREAIRVVRRGLDKEDRNKLDNVGIEAVKGMENR
jgi:hypothetical protein